MPITLNGDTGIVSPAIDVTTPITVSDGGTGLSSPGTTGNVLTSNGTAWTSAALPAGGVTSLNGQTGAITNTDADVIGSVCWGYSTSACAIGSTVAGSTLRGQNSSSGAVTNPGFSGTWRNTGCIAIIANASTTQATFMRIS